MLYLWYYMICAYLSKPFGHNSSICVFAWMCPKNAQQMLAICANCVHFCPFLPIHSLTICTHASPQELMCGHICTRSSRIKIVHAPNSDLVYQLVLIGSHMFKFIYICKWFVGFYFLLPCILNWNFALGEIYQFKLFYLNATFTTINWRERDDKKISIG